MAHGRRPGHRRPAVRRSARVADPRRTQRPSRPGRVHVLAGRHRPRARTSCAGHRQEPCRARSLIAIRDNETAAAVMGVDRAADEDARVRTGGGDDRRRRSPVRHRLNGVNADLRLFTLVGSITFVVVMVIRRGDLVGSDRRGHLCVRRAEPVSGAPTATASSARCSAGWRARRRRSSSPSCCWC